MRSLLLIIAVFLPSPVKCFVYRFFLGWEIGKNAKIGLTYINAEKVVIKNNVHIGHLNIFQRIKYLEIGNDCYFGKFNQFSGSTITYPEESGWTRQLILKNKVLFMNNHFIDVAGTVKIGSESVFAGRDTHLWSHTRTIEENIPNLIPINIEIGEEVYIGARSTILLCNIPNQAMIGAGSVVTKTFHTTDRVLIAGNPATIKKHY